MFSIKQREIECRPGREKNDCIFYIEFFFLNRKMCLKKRRKTIEGKHTRASIVYTYSNGASETMERNRLTIEKGGDGSYSSTYIYFIHRLFTYNLRRQHLTPVYYCRSHRDFWYLQDETQESSWNTITARVYIYYSNMTPNSCSYITAIEARCSDGGLDRSKSDIHRWNFFSYSSKHFTAKACRRCRTVNRTHLSKTKIIF